MGDKPEIMRPEHSEHPELTGRQVGDKCEIMRPEHSEHPELTGRQVGDKCEIMRPEHSEHPELTRRQVGDKWETSVKSCGQALRASRAYWKTSGRQMGKWKTRV